MKVLAKICRQCSLLILLSASILSFPADDIASLKTKTDLPTTVKLPTSNAESTTTESSASGSTAKTTLQPQDKKQFLSYVLGHPKKPASLKTPSSLMNPDKYEFYTFDDDGQIVKKLMSVQEIQRIIANNERGKPSEPHNPNEYYHIITVSPDVEPPPAVSRINPSEPIFSVHDVIASVQNVLKSEISLKRGQGTTRQPDSSVEIVQAAGESTKISDTTGTQESIKITTYRPKLQTDKTDKTKTEKMPTMPSEIPAPTSPPLAESVPLLLSDAHPGLVSNDTFLEPQQSVIEQFPQIDTKREESPATTRTTTTTTTTTTARTTTMAPVTTTVSKLPKPSIPETAMSQVQIPMNQDLAESVSSVLSQIASEISLGKLGSSLLANENAMTRTNAEDEDNSSKKTENVNVDDIYLTTELPEMTTIADMETTEAEVDQKQKVTMTTIQPQNRPRPFESVKEEKTVPTTEESETTTTTDFQTMSMNVYLPLDTKMDDSKLEPKEDGIVLIETAPTTIPPKTPEEVTPGSDLSRPQPEKLVAAASTKINETVEATGNVPPSTERQILGEVTEMTTGTEEANEGAEARITELYSETTVQPMADVETEADTEIPETTTVEEEPENLTEQESRIKSSTEVAPTEVPTTETPDPEMRTDKPADEKGDKAELKTLPETSTDSSTQSPESTQKPVEDIQGSLKQNVAYKPFFGKPQKPVYIKPTKVKTPVADAKPTKPTGAKPARDPTKDTEPKRPYENHFQSSPSTLELDAAPAENLGLESTTLHLDKDVKEFTELCNELAFSLWSSVTHSGLSFVRSVVVSPFAVTSLLAMVFLGARGPTSGQMNDVLKLDEMVTFNPHLVFRNVTESLVISRNPGVATAAFVRELYSDKSKGKLLDFYKERAQQFYDGHVEEVNFKTVGDNLRRQTNHLVKRQTWGKITDFLRGSTLQLRPPLAAFSANIFQTDCTKASTKDRDGEMYFVVLPASRLRRLVPVPAVVVRDNFLAGYEPNLDATAVAVGPTDSAVTTIFVLPGQQGLIAPGDTLARLEHHLLGSSFKRGHWTRLMRSLLPRPGLELQIPRMSHRSVVNVTSSLQRMGLRDLFSAQKADLTGLNGLANDLHLSDMLQVNLFSTCGEDGIGSRHISEVYPATPLLRREKSSDTVFSDSIDNLFAVSDFEDPAISAMPLELRPRQARIPLSKPGARIPEPPRLRFDRPFLFFVRHNPTGLILHMGRFNPRLTT